MKKRRATKKAKAEKELEEITNKLNEKQRLFCEFYVYSKDHFCNAARSYSDAYGLKPYQHVFARTSGHRLITNVYVKAYIDSLLDKAFNHKRVDQELARVFVQNKNMLAKMQAIDSYNKLKGRIEDKSKVELVIPSPIYGGRSTQKV